MDNNLVSIANEIRKNEADLKVPSVHLVLVDKKIVKLYNLLVVETPKILTIEHVKESFDKLGAGLQEKVAAALSNSEKKESEELPINMSGIGQA